MAWFEPFREGPRACTMLPFWFLNDDLDPAELRRQIDDFAAHGVYGFIPHARTGLPPHLEFMSEAWLDAVEVCVAHAAEKDMQVVLYDEGQYPSGSCAGQVVAEDPRYAARCLVARERGELAEGEELIAEAGAAQYVHCPSGGTIRGVVPGTDDGQPGAHPQGDLLNPEAAEAFIRLAYGGHYERLKDFFGSTIVGFFTDEPDPMGRRHRPGAIPWTWGFGAELSERLEQPLEAVLPVLFDPAHADHAARRLRFQEAVNARMAEAFFIPAARWCAERGIALTGHPKWSTDLGLMQHMQWPGQDLVWRYVERNQPSALEGDHSTMAKAGASAQAHGGRTRNWNECFGAYGHELTWDEMSWVTNWLFVRGVNGLMPHAFFYSTRDGRGDERPPDVGPNSPWWDRFGEYAAFVCRMGWVLSAGRINCNVAILASAARLPWRAAKACFTHQRDFLYLDADTLLEQAEVSAEGVRVGELFYKALVVDGTDLLGREAWKKLAPAVESGRVLTWPEPIAGLTHAADEADFIAALDAVAPRDVQVQPACPGLRYTRVRHPEGEVYVFANEGAAPLEAALDVTAPGQRRWWDPWNGGEIERPDNKLTLAPGQLLVMSVEPD